MPRRWRSSPASSTRASRRSPIPPPIKELKAALAGTGIEAGAGESALVEAAERPAEWVMAAIVRLGRA